jgi:hypothetical protein
MKFIYVLRWVCSGCGKQYKYHDMISGCPECNSIKFETNFVLKYWRTVRYYSERCLSGLKELFAKQSG